MLHHGNLDRLLAAICTLRRILVLELPTVHCIITETYTAPQAFPFPRFRPGA